MGKLIQIPARTYKAKLFKVPWRTDQFKLAGTLDGFIDLVVPQGGTYPLSLDEARHLIGALNDTISDVQANCLYGNDILLD